MLVLVAMQMMCQLVKGKALKPLDWVPCVAAALWGIGAFIFALRLACNPMGPQPG